MAFKIISFLFLHIHELLFNHLLHFTCFLSRCLIPAHREVTTEQGDGFQRGITDKALSYTFELR